MHEVIRTEGFGRYAHPLMHACFSYDVRRYFDAPEIYVTTEGGNRDEPFMYIPSHLYHIFFELLKNSCRAVTELHEKLGHKGKMPPVEVSPLLVSVVNFINLPPTIYL
jgi:hypothetical protein